MNIQTFDALASTNQYCELLNLSEVEEFTVINARSQTAGIGQRGNHWTSEPGKNLTFSIILKPAFLPVPDQYQLTKAVSLAVTDYLAPLLPQGNSRVKIKWPNDIYVDNQKICGMLISNRIAAGRLSASIVGIGLNINQQAFPSWVPNPTSLSLLTERQWPLEETLTDLLSAIQSRYEELRNTPPGTLDNPYLARLLNLNQKARYLLHEKEIEATITGVNRFGHLQLLTPAGSPLSCQMKEIQFL